MLEYKNWIARNPMGDKQRESLKTRFSSNSVYEAETLRRRRESELTKLTDDAHVSMVGISQPPHPRE